jgi:hypothetical protein
MKDLHHDGGIRGAKENENDLSLKKKEKIFLVFDRCNGSTDCAQSIYCPEMPLFSVQKDVGGGGTTKK